MDDNKVIPNGGGGALIISKDPITNREIIIMGLSTKEEVLDFHKKITDFIVEEYHVKDKEV